VGNPLVDVGFLEDVQKNPLVCLIQCFREFAESADNLGSTMQPT
jgi:hypothetical protein